jgi:predicted MPP superfamily phosphohydrolase
MRRTGFRILALLLLGTFAAAQNGPSPAQLELHLPLEKNSVRFAVIGDSGTGDREQYDIAEEMAKYREKVNFDFVIMLGDNIYGGHDAKDLKKKFETPYKVLLDAGVKFYASLGNHDDPGTEIAYKPFNMNGERYYFFKKGDVAFYALDSNYMDPIQLSWLQENLQKSAAKWKVPYFHHPLYNNGRIHGADVDLRSRLEPLFKQYGVNIVFSGHEHAYERFRPQNGIYYFVLGSSAKLIDHDFRSMDNLEKAFDADRTFAIVEISGDKLYYQTIARRWQTIDYGVVQRQAPPATKSASAR